MKNATHTPPTHPSFRLPRPAILLAFFIVPFGILLIWQPLKRLPPATTSTDPEPAYLNTVPTPDPITLTLSPNTTDWQVGTSYPIKVSFASQPDPATTVIELKFNFNPTTMSLTHINPVALWEDQNVIINDIDDTTGTAHLTVARGFKSDVIDGTHIATLTFRPKTTTPSTTITLDPTSSLATTDNDQLYPLIAPALIVSAE